MSVLIKIMGQPMLCFSQAALVKDDIKTADYIGVSKNAEIVISENACFRV